MFTALIAARLSPETRRETRAFPHFEASAPRGRYAEAIPDVARIAAAKRRPRPCQATRAVYHGSHSRQRLAMKPSSRLRAHAQALESDSGRSKPPLTVSFVSQKGGVGKSTLARLLAVGAAHRGLRPLLADFDLEQLTCVEWSAIRMQHSVEPDIDARAFKSLKKLRKSEERAKIVVVDTRGLADELAHDIAEDSDVVFLPTGASGDDLRPTLALARKLAKNGAEGRIVLVLSKIGRSEAQLQKAIATIEESGFELLAERWPQRDGFQADLDSGRAGRESRNPYLREAAEKMEEALFARAKSAKPR